MIQNEQNGENRHFSGDYHCVSSYGVMHTDTQWPGLAGGGGRAGG